MVLTIGVTLVIDYKMETLKEKDREKIEELKEKWPDDFKDLDKEWY